MRLNWMIWACLLLFLLPVGVQAQSAAPDTIEVSERELERALQDIARSVQLEELQQMVMELSALQQAGGSRYNDERMDRLERMVYGLAGRMGYLPSGQGGRNLIVLPGNGGVSALPVYPMEQQQSDRALTRQIELLQEQLALLEERVGEREAPDAGVDSTRIRLQSLRAEVERLQKEREEQSRLMAVEHAKADSLFTAFRREELGESQPAPTSLQDQAQRDRFAALYRRQLFFPVSSHTLTKEAVGALQEVLQVLKSEPEMKVSLTGYSSPEGNRAYNRTLSEKRAEAAAAWLRQNGVADRRIRVVPEGVDDQSDMRTYGRRVDVTLE